MSRGHYFGYLLLHPVDTKYYRVRQLLDEFGYETSWGQRIVPMDDEKTDLGSIPALVWWVPGFARDRYARSYVIHDHNYWLRLFPRWFCDFILLGGLFVELKENASRIPKWWRWAYLIYNSAAAFIVFSFVRAFGWLAWYSKGRRHRLQDKARWTSRSSQNSVSSTTARC
jgi:hypothetical protein